MAQTTLRTASAGWAREATAGQQQQQQQQQWQQNRSTGLGWLPGRLTPDDFDQVFQRPPDPWLRCCVHHFLNACRWEVSVSAPPSARQGVRVQIR
jgi:hypothetical protein